MNDKYLFKYYFNDNNELSHIPSMLNCFETCIYYILKTKLTNTDCLMDLFLKDINIKLTLDKNGKAFKDIGIISAENNNDLIKVKYHKGIGKETLNEIYSILDKGESVIIKTYYDRLIFFKDYKGKDAPIVPFDVDVYHVLLIIGHNDGKIFYVESPINVNKNHITYFANKTIGVVTEEDFLVAADVFLDYYTVDVNDNYVFETDKVNLMIREIVENYYTGPKLINNDVILYGKRAANEFKIILENDRYDSSKNRYLHNRFQDYSFITGIRNIDRSRRVLKEVLVKYYNLRYIKDMYDVLERIDSSILSWRIGRSIIEKWRISNKKLLHELNLDKYLGTAFEQDKKLISCLEKLFQVKI